MLAHFAPAGVGHAIQAQTVGLQVNLGQQPKVGKHVVVIGCGNSGMDTVVGAYQMGAEGLSKFTNTLRSVAKQDWHAAQAGMLASKWRSDTPNRAHRHAIQMLNGNWYPDYK